MIFVLGIILGVLAYHLQQKWLLKRKRDRAQSLLQARADSASTKATEQMTQPPVARVRRILEIEGTQQISLDTSVLNSWGLSKNTVQDVAGVAGPVLLSEVPASVSDCLASCFFQSGTRGVEVNQVLKSGLLPEGKQLCFVLSETSPGNSTITALVV